MAKSEIGEMNRLRIIRERAAAEFLGLSLGHVRRLRRQGAMPKHYLIGARSIGYRFGDLLDWLETKASEPPEASTPGAST